MLGEVEIEIREKLEEEGEVEWIVEEEQLGIYKE